MERETTVDKGRSLDDRPAQIAPTDRYLENVAEDIYPPLCKAIFDTLSYLVSPSISLRTLPPFFERLLAVRTIIITKTSQITSKMQSTSTVERFSSTEENVPADKMVQSLSEANLAEHISIQTVRPSNIKDRITSDGAL